MPITYLSTNHMGMRQTINMADHFQLGLEQVMTHLSRGMYTKRAIDGLVMLWVKVRGYKGVMVLSPCEDVTPMAQIISNDRKAVAPCLYGGFHVMQWITTAVLQCLVDLCCLLKLHNLQHGTWIKLYCMCQTNGYCDMSSRKKRKQLRKRWTRVK